MLPWPAQLTPYLGLDRTSFLLVVMALLSAMLLGALLLLLRSIRRRNASHGVDAGQERALSKEESLKKTSSTAANTTVREGQPVSTETAGTAATPMLAKLFSTEERATATEVEPIDLQSSDADLESDADAESDAGIETDDLLAGDLQTEPAELLGAGAERQDLPLAAQPLAKIEARAYLEQVNQHVLMDRGEIREEPGKLELSWQTKNGPRSVFVTATPNERELTINGIPFEASPDGLKKGIVAGLKNPDNSEF